MPAAKFHPDLYRLRPWYHDFSSLGVQTIFPAEGPQLGRHLKNLGRTLLGRERHPALLCRSYHYLLNQRCKEPILVDLLRRALGALNADGARPRCLDLFCADGYYSCLIRRLAPSASVTGVDRNGDDLERARAAAAALDMDGLTFVQADVFDFLAGGGPFDLVVCAGGLYHLSRPADLIAAVASAARRFALFQSVVTEETEDPDYFVTPAPGWSHGSRFSHLRLRSWISAAGLKVLAEQRNQLTGNRKVSDRGSSYFLCAP